MNHSSLESLFSLFDDTATIIESELSCTYLEALVLTTENIFQNKITTENLSEIAVKKLEKLYNIDFERLLQSSEEVRKSFQLAILKGMREYVQPNHQMTPDGIGLLINYLVEKLMADKKTFTILDLAVGTGNLLTTILNGQKNKKIDAFGVEIDELLLKIAFANANLQGHPIQFFNQDSLESLFIDPVDLIVADLPIGYYPNDERARDYAVYSKKEHTYAHHLFIEQSSRYVKEGGYLIFIIPNNLFETEQSALLHEFIKDNLVIQGLLQLPSELFANKQMKKSIFILQKKKDNLKMPKEVLLAQLPDLTNAQAVERIISKINNWFTENKE